MSSWTKLVERRWTEAIGDPEFREYVDKNHREKEKNISIDHVNVDEKERLLRIKGYLSQLPESLIYYHATDAGPEEDEYVIGGETINESELINKSKTKVDDIANVVYERIMSFMAGAQKMEPKRKVYLGNKPDGTSDPVNKGDLSAVKLTPIDSSRKDTPNMQERTGDIEYGVLMIDYKYEKWKEVCDKIDKKDIYDKEGYGLEDHPHLTVLYGFHGNVVPEKVFEAIKKVTSDPIEIELTKISLFESEEYDVLKFDVKKTPLLTKMHAACKKFPHTLTFPDYHPHVTIGYLKKGKGKKYIDDMKKSIILKSGDLVFSSKEKKKTNIKLK